MKHYGLTIALLLVAMSSHGQPLYVVIEPDLPAGATGQQINNHGQIAGNWSIPERPQRGFPLTQAFLWLPRPAVGLPAGFHNLESLGGSPFFSNGLNLNDATQVVGFSETGKDELIGFVWSGTMERRDPLTPGTPTSDVRAINELGQAVGSEGTSFVCRPMIWLEEPAYGLPAGASILDTSAFFPEGAAADINALGQVVGRMAGSCDIAGGERAFLWLPSSAHGLPAGMNDITAGIDPGAAAEAFALNDAGQVVGWFNPADISLPSQGFLWQDGVLTLLDFQPGATSSIANDISESGQIVGSSGGSAALWDDLVLSDLNDLIASGSGWDLRSARSINDHGQILGLGLIEGDARTFLLDPILFADDFESGDTSRWTGG